MLQLANLEKQFDTAPNTIYQYVTDMENYKNWFPGVIEIQSVDELPAGTIGKCYVETIELPSGRGKLTIEVKEAIPNKIFSTEGDLPFLLPRMTMRFRDAANGGCAFSLSYESRNADIAAEQALLDSVRDDLAERSAAGLQNLERILTSPT